MRIIFLEFFTNAGTRYLINKSFWFNKPKEKEKKEKKNSEALITAFISIKRIFHFWLLCA